jgi:hypothetical protein
LDYVIVTSQLARRASLTWLQSWNTNHNSAGPGTAGVSLIDVEDGAEVFRAEAVVGILSNRLESRIARARPCGTAIDGDATQLMYLPERVFSNLRFDPPILEALIIPFRVQSRPAGTVWVVAHDDNCKCDRADERIGRTPGVIRCGRLALTGGATKRRTRYRATAKQQTPWKRCSSRRDRQTKAYGGRVAVAEPKPRSPRLRENGGLDCREVRVETPRDLQDESQQSSLNENATAKGEMGDFNRLLTVIQGYTTIMKADLDDPAKLKDGIEAIREATSLV